MPSFWNDLSAANKRMIVRVGIGLVVLVGGWIFTQVAASDGDNDADAGSQTSVEVADDPDSADPDGADPDIADLGAGIGGLDTDGATTTDPAAPNTTSEQNDAEPGESPTTAQVLPPTTRGPPTTQRPVPTTVYQYSNLAAISVDELPDEAIETLRLIDDGGPYPYSQDDGTFGNFEGRLPDQNRGYYREYTVDTPGLSHRGALRIVSGQDGDLYWTDDHYDSFAEIIDW